jgi:hypothetical protein
MRLERIALSQMRLQSVEELLAALEAKPPRKPQ